MTAEEDVEEDIEALLDELAEYDDLESMLAELDEEVQLDDVEEGSGGQLDDLVVNDEE